MRAVDCEQMPRARPLVAFALAMSQHVPWQFHSAIRVCRHSYSRRDTRRAQIAHNRRVTMATAIRELILDRAKRERHECTTDDEREAGNAVTQFRVPYYERLTECMSTTRVLTFIERARSIAPVSARNASRVIRCAASDFQNAKTQNWVLVGALCRSKSRPMHTRE